MFNAKVIDNIKQNLLGRKEKLAVAESVTSGFLQAAIASAELALQFFEGGITVYNIDQKVKHLNIDRKTGEACNCVSGQTASEMALGVCELFETDWGISVTGYATRVPESDNRLFAFFAIAYKGKLITAEKMEFTEKLEAEEAQLKYMDRIIRRFSEVLARESQHQQVG